MSLTSINVCHSWRLLYVCMRVFTRWFRNDFNIVKFTNGRGRFDFRCTLSFLLLPFTRQPWSNIIQTPNKIAHVHIYWFDWKHYVGECEKKRFQIKLIKFHIYWMKIETERSRTLTPLSTSIQKLQAVKNPIKETWMFDKGLLFDEMRKATVKRKSIA